MTPDQRLVLADVLEEARQRWPSVSWQAGTFERYVCERGAAGSLHLLDLALAYACGLGDKAALATFETEVLVLIDPPLKRMGLNAAAIDEVRQRVRMRLLVGSDAKIRDYRATGPLGAWVRAVAAREQLQLRRADARLEAFETRDENTPAAHELRDDPPGRTSELEIEALRGQYREAVQRAFTCALATLAPADRELLRAHHLEHQGPGALAQRFGIHRATIHRRLARVRREVFDRTRDMLVHDFGASPPSIESVISLVRNELYLSIERLNGTTSRSGSDDEP